MGDVLVDAVPPNAVHLCVDMQRIFSADTRNPVEVVLDATEAEAVLLVLERSAAGQPLTEADWQRIFSSDGPWPTPWMERVLPAVTRIAERFPERTVFTRFITPAMPADATGRWRSYYEKWRETTRDRLDPRLLELMPPSRHSFRRHACSTSPFTPHSRDISSTDICRIGAPTRWW